MSDLHSEHRDPHIDQLLDMWRWKVRAVTYAIVVTGVGLAAAPMLVLGTILPFGQTLISGIVAAGATAIAIPVGLWLARLGVPRRSADGLSGTDAAAEEKTSDGSKATIAEARRELVEEALEELIENTSVGPFLRKYAWGCVVLTKASPRGALFTGMAGAVMTAAAAAPIPLSLGTLVSGPALAALALASAMRLRFPVLLAPPRDFEEPFRESESAADVPPSKPRPTGLEILEKLRSSPIYRRQDVAVQELQGRPMAVGKGLEILTARYPRLTDSMLSNIGIHRLSSGQSDAVAEILSSSGSDASHNRDYVFIGWPGSGRSTLCNLLTVCSLLHREGAVHCVSPESPVFNLNQMAGARNIPTARHPVAQLRDWLASTPYAEKIQEAYSDQPAGRLEFHREPDVVFTDVRVLSDEILGKATGDARGLIERLKFVVIDHPNRLPREDLIRLRIAISRLRMTAEMFGRSITFVVMLPRLNNFAELAKWLLNNDQVPFVPFDGWYGPALVAGWLPPHEFVERGSSDPLFARADYSHEVIELLTELGVQAHELRSAGLDPLRIAVVDAQPLLGPEFRSQLGELVLDRLKMAVPHTETIEVIQDWTYFGTSDLTINRDEQFDVIVCAGIGPHPEHLVASLRAALTDKGAMILIADASTVDYESLRTIREPGWDPYDAMREARYPKFVLPKHSEAIIAHEIASLFEDFKDRPVPRERLAGVFPSEHTDELLEGWARERILEVMEAFELQRDDTTPRRAPYLRQSGSSPLTGGRYEVPWGCCSRDVFTIYDRTSKSESRRVGPSLSTFIDRDRIFIDFFPQAVLRYPPNTVEVSDLEPRSLSAKEMELAREHWVSHGRLVVSQVDYDAGIEIDRRIARFRTELLQERPFKSHSSEPLPSRILLELDGHPLISTLRVFESNGTGGTEVETAVTRAREIVASTLRPAISSGGLRPPVRFVGGTWICRLREGIKDSVQTGPRLVEDHQLVRTVEMPPRTRAYLEREFDCVATCLAIEITPAAYELPLGAAGGLDEVEGEDPGLDRNLIADFGAHHGLARTIRFYLMRQFMEFDREYRIAVVPTGAKPEQSLSWAPGPVPEPGPAGRTAAYDPGAVADVIDRTFPSRRIVSTVVQDRLEELCSLFDWMHANIQCMRGKSRGRGDRNPATPAEALQRGAGSGEAHALVFGSLCRAVGFEARTALVSDHAFCEVYLGRKEELGDVSRLGETIRDYLMKQGARRELRGLERPYRNGELARGWRRVDGRVERDPEILQPEAFPILWHDIYLDETDDGEMWMVADDCTGSYLGDPSGLVEAAFLDLEGRWSKDIRYEYPLPLLTSWRILIHRIRQDELHPDEHLTSLLDREIADEVLPWVVDRLEGCDCDDGCSACCGGLGTITSQAWQSKPPGSGKFSEADVVSRRGAYRLTCALLGRTPDWKRFGLRPGSKPRPTSGDQELRAMVAEIIGTASGEYRDGTWHRMFGELMEFDPEKVAEASWMSDADKKELPNCAGAYRWPENTVRILADLPRDETLAALVHEYTHNWQWTSDFDRGRLRDSDELAQFFEGLLVTEGHARWADHTYRFHRGTGSVYRTTDPSGWDEYKTGYFLLEGIYNAFGERGLFRWLSSRWREEPGLRSRDRRLKWPFTVTEALQAFGLLEEARSGKFDGIDVVVSRGKEEDADGYGKTPEADGGIESIPTTAEIENNPESGL